MLTNSQPKEGAEWGWLPGNELPCTICGFGGVWSQEKMGGARKFHLVNANSELATWREGSTEVNGAHLQTVLEGAQQRNNGGWPSGSHNCAI